MGVANDHSIAWAIAEAAHAQGATLAFTHQGPSFVRRVEPLAESGHAIPDQSARAAIYAEGLARWRARDFSGAAECFERIAASDPPSARFLGRAKEFASHPPDPDWQPVCTLEAK